MQIENTILIIVTIIATILIVFDVFEGREIFLSKKQYDMVKKRGYYYIYV